MREKRMPRHTRGVGRHERQPARVSDNEPFRRRRILLAAGLLSAAVAILSGSEKKDRMEEVGTSVEHIKHKFSEHDLDQARRQLRMGLHFLEQVAQRPESQQDLPVEEQKMEAEKLVDSIDLTEISITPSDILNHNPDCSGDAQQECQTLLSQMKIEQDPDFISIRLNTPEGEIDAMFSVEFEKRQHAGTGETILMPVFATHGGTTWDFGNKHEAMSEFEGGGSSKAFRGRVQFWARTYVSGILSGFLNDRAEQSASEDEEEQTKDPDESEGKTNPE